MRRHRLRVAFGLAAIALGVAGRPPHMARADAVVGDGTPASCTEAALNAAIAAAGLIQFNCGAAPKVIVITAEKAVTADTTFEGGGVILLSGNDATRIFTVAPGKRLTLTDMILTNGDSNAGDGGAIYNDAGDVVLNRSAIQASRSLSWGGAIASHGGSLTLVESTIRDNRALRGAIHVSGTLTVLTSTITANTAIEAGGGLHILGTADIRSTQVYSNRVEAGDGGGLYVGEASVTVIRGGAIERNAAIAENRHGGGIASRGTVVLQDVVVRRNAGYQGGGIWNDGGEFAMEGGGVEANVAQAAGGMLNDGGDMRLEEVAIVDNLATVAAAGIANNGGTAVLDSVTISGNSTLGDLTTIGGGALVTQGNVTMTNVTISDNFATGGGGIFTSGGTTSLGHVTLADNASSGDGDAIYRENGLVVLHNTVVAGRFPQDIVVHGRPDGPLQNATCFGAITSAGFNLGQDGSCGLTAASDLPNTPPELYRLADNGGFTLTHMPRPNSLAIDTGAPTCPASDQRGHPRPVGAGCDRGSVEVDELPTPTPSATASPTPTATASPTPTETASPTPTATPTGTPSSTATGTPSATATETPTASTTQTPSATASPTTAQTPLATATGATATPSPTGTPGEATESPTPSETDSTAGTPDATGTHTPAPTETPIGSRIFAPDVRSSRR